MKVHHEFLCVFVFKNFIYHTVFAGSLFIIIIYFKDDCGYLRRKW